jgi:hypothetical protein
LNIGHDRKIEVQRKKKYPEFFGMKKKIYVMVCLRLKLVLSKTNVISGKSLTPYFVFCIKMLGELLQFTDFKKQLDLDRKRYDFLFSQD